MTKRRMACAGLLAVMLGMLGPGSAPADHQITLVADRDNTIFEEGGSISNGAGDYFFTGNNNNSNARRALVHFGVAGLIPAGSTINSVTLTLNMSRAEDSSTRTTTLHRVLADWGEGSSDAGGEEGTGASAETGDATWTYRFYSTTLWGTSGGQFNATASASLGVQNEGSYTWVGAGMIADVQGWLDNPGANFGWLIRGVENTNKTAKRFDTHDHPTASRRPILTIGFTPPAVTGACCLSDGSCFSLAATECAAQGGTYQGDGSSCTPNPCPQPVGACCLPSGDCQQLTAANCALQSGTYEGNNTPCTSDLCPVVLEPFVDPLPLPAVAMPVSGVPGGAASYVIAMQEITQKLHRDLPPTRLWGYGGSYPGPTIEAASGVPITVQFVSDLRDSNGVLRTTHYLPVDTCLHGPNHHGDMPRTVVHLHGGHVPFESDGYPDSTMLPGQSQTFVYPNNQPPATIWYHDHALGITRLNVMMGMAGFYLIRDAFEVGLGLPSGENEVAMAIQDRMFHSDGSLEYPEMWMEHFFGDKILVNGKVWPYFNVKRGKYRFRMLNGSNSRAYTLTMSNGAGFLQIGTDGGLLDAPVGLTSVTLLPGERADLVVDFGPYAPGTEITLLNSAPAPFPGMPGVGVIPNVMKFIVGSETGHTAAVPVSLRPVEVLPETSAVLTRTFELRKVNDPCRGIRWTINGLMWDDITEFPVLGTTEIWSFINRSGVAHPMHPHLVHVQVLDRQTFTTVGDSIVPSGPRIPPPDHERGWKDTFRTDPNQITRVIMKFTDYEGLFAYHCHMLEHEDHEMMRQFQTVPAVAVPLAGPPGSLALRAVGANPFQPPARIEFTLPASEHVKLAVFDLGGRRVRSLLDGNLAGGTYRWYWDGADDQQRLAAPGLYVVRLAVGREVATLKLMMIR